MPRHSLVIPAWNEAKLLPRLLATVEIAREHYSAEHDAIEVIVADNVSTDSTAEIARSHGCIVASVDERRIAAVRNGGAAMARGEILNFVDADSQIHPDTFLEIDEVLASGRVVGGASGVRMERWSPGILATWCLLIPLVVALRMDTGVVFCRRADFEAIGGYSRDRFFAEDVEFLLALRRLGKSHGQKLARLRRSKAIASTRKFDRHGDWHYFKLIAEVFADMIRNPKAASEYAKKYWYEDER